MLYSAVIGPVAVCDDIYWVSQVDHGLFLELWQLVMMHLIDRWLEYASSFWNCGRTGGDILGCPRSTTNLTYSSCFLEVWQLVMGFLVVPG